MLTRFRSHPSTLTIVLCTLAGSLTAAPAALASAEPAFVTKWGTMGGAPGQFNYPHGVATDPSGNVYVTDFNNHRVQKFDSAGTFGAQWGNGVFGHTNNQFNSPSGVARDAAGNFYVSDRSNNRVVKLTSTGAYIAQWGTAGSNNGQFSAPYGVATDAAGDVYIVDLGNSRVQKFTSAGAFVTKWGAYGSGDGQFTSPSGIATDSAGNVYVTDRETGRVQKFSSTGAFIGKWGLVGSGEGQLLYPIGVATDAAGNVYVAESGNDRVQKFTSTGAFIATWGTSGSGDGQFTSPSGVATDSAGGIYVTDSLNHRVQKFAFDTTPPQTTITAGPTGEWAAGKTNDSTPMFTFESDDPQAWFECSVDGGTWLEGCGSPHTTASLADGQHSFRVRANDPVGNVDLTPAERTFTVEPRCTLIRLPLTLLGRQHVICLFQARAARVRSSHGVSRVVSYRARLVRGRHIYASGKARGSHSVSLRTTRTLRRGYYTLKVVAKTADGRRLTGRSSVRITKRLER